MEGQLALGALLDRFPQLRLAVPVEDLHWGHGDGLVLRGLTDLPVIPGPARPRRAAADTSERTVTMTRKVADCRDFPSENNCTLTISGTQSEVLQAAAEHAVSTHGHTDGPELRKQILAMLKDEVDLTAV